MRRLIASQRVLRLAMLAGTAALGACAAAPVSEHPQEYLDKQTAATISVVDRPLVFARERPDRAVHVRDYATVSAAAVDRQGHTDYVLIAYFWSTLDAHDEPRTAGPLRPDESQDVTVLADDRLIRLHVAGHSAADAGIGVPVHAPPARAVVPDVYRTDLATLRYMASARHLALLRDDASDSRYELWDDRRGSLAGLVRLLSGQD